LALFGSVEARQYPIVATTYRVTEHFLSGVMTRNLPHLAEMVPAMFVELSKELAAEKGIKPGDRVRVSSVRATAGIEARAVVTGRFRPFRINGKRVHQLGMPFHFGFVGLTTGESANDLTPHIGDANTLIQECKAFLCNVEKV
jgi:formate dehydrogenase major subunit